jgi:hypothetical protein
MTLEEIANIIVEKQNSLKAEINCKEIVELEESALSREILEKRIAQKLLQDSILKVSNNIKRLHIEIRQLTNEFWEKKSI